jgi:LuxR family maltose regulon positive regulatory protein
LITAFVQRLLAAFEAWQMPGHLAVSINEALVEPLTEREIDVLKHLEQGCTDKQIAASLVIASETVHKHLKNIYGKLDVHSRTEALARAHKLGLL